MSPAPAFPDLMLRVRAGVPGAAEELLRLYEPEVRRYIRLKLTDPRLRRYLESADILQSVLANFFVRVVDGRFDLQTPGQLIGLLKAMANHKIIDHARRPTNQQTTPAAGVLEGLAGREQAPDDAVAWQELLAAVLGHLSDAERRLAVLWSEGRTWPQIAAECGGTPDALRKKLERGIDRACAQIGLVRRRDE